MLHAEFQDHRTSGSREERFFLSYMNMEAILVMMQPAIYLYVQSEKWQRSSLPDSTISEQAPSY